jgi:hypothetical protein
MILTSAECTTIMIAELTVTSGLGSSLDYWELVWFGYGWVRKPLRQFALL